MFSGLLAEGAPPKSLRSVATRSSSNTRCGRAHQDTSTRAQRNRDALKGAARALLASGQLGQHRGLPVTVIVSTTLQELESAAGQAVTGGGTLLPMTDLIRMASHSHHYLAIFGSHTS